MSESDLLILLGIDLIVSPWLRRKKVYGYGKECVSVVCVFCFEAIDLHAIMHSHHDIVAVKALLCLRLEHM